VKLKLDQFSSKFCSNTKIEKNTNNDKISHIRDEISYLFEINGIKEYAYYQDHDDDYIYFDIWSGVDQNYTFWKVSYSYNGTKVSIPEVEATQVVRTTEWKDLVEDIPVDKASIIDLIEKTVKGIFKKEMPIIKQFNDEEMISVEPLFSIVGVTDAHGDAATAEATNQLIQEFNKAVDEGYMQAGLFHKHLTKSYYYKKAWMVEEDAMYGDSLVKAGTPLVELQFTNDKAWELKKANKFMPPSIGAQGSVEEI